MPRLRGIDKSAYQIGEVIGVMQASGVPFGTMICDGSLLSVHAYPKLFAAIGVIYGGDGVNNFRIPDFRGRMPLGAGQGTGLTNRVLGQPVGEEAVSLGIEHMPPHNHPGSNTSPAGDHRHSYNRANTSASADAFGSTSSNNYITSQTDYAGAHQHSVTINDAGTQATVPHGNIQPALVTRMVIAYA